MIANLEKRLTILTDIVKTHEDNINSLTQLVYDLRNEVSELKKKDKKKDK